MAVGVFNKILWDAVQSIMGGPYILLVGNSLFVFDRITFTNVFSLYDLTDYSVVYIVGHTDYKHT